MRALEGRRVLVTRPRHQSDAIMQKLAEHGAVPIAFPTIEIAALEDQSRLDEALHNLGRYHWLIFTSVNGVEVFWERYTALFPALDSLGRIKVAAIGPATAQALADRGLNVDYVPEAFIAEAVAAGIGDVDGMRVLLPRAETAREALVVELDRRGAQVDELPIYQTNLAQPDPQAWQELDRGVDIVTFTSSSTVRNFFVILKDRAADLLRGAVIACIGPITAGTVEEYGFEASIVADDYTASGLVQALLDYTGKITREG